LRVWENFETIAADLRKRALEVKKQDEGLRKRDLEMKERKQQQQLLKRSQRALKGSVSQIITVGLKRPTFSAQRLFAQIPISILRRLSRSTSSLRQRIHGYAQKEGKILWSGGPKRG
jgi:hypothetical protein